MPWIWCNEKSLDLQLIVAGWVVKVEKWRASRDDLARLVDALLDGHDHLIVRLGRTGER